MPLYGSLATTRAASPANRCEVWTLLWLFFLEGFGFQVEQTPDGVFQGGRFRFTRCRFQRRDRSMQDLVNDGFRETVDGHLLLRSHRAQPASRAIDLSLADGLDLLL